MTKQKIKKRICAAIMAFAVIISTCVGCDKSENSLTKVKLTEVAHSIFYAPMYVAIENNYFAEEGIDLELINGFGADKVMAAVVAGETDIGFCGAEASVYLYAEGASNYVVNFAQLTQRAGNFLVSRKPVKDFTWDMLKDKEVLGGRKGGMPEMVFEYILEKNNINPEKDLSIDQSIDFGSTAAAFSGGQGDFTIEFEPSATALEAAGEGYVVASLGVDSGYVPYTSYCVTKEYMKENEKVIQGFTSALQKGMEYVNTHTPAEIAKIIAPQFEDFDVATIETIVTRYYEQDTWKDNLVFEESSFDLLQNILTGAGELDDKVPYENLVDNRFAKKAYEDSSK